MAPQGLWRRVALPCGGIEGLERTRRRSFSNALGRRPRHRYASFSQSRPPGLLRLADHSVDAAACAGLAYAGMNDGTCGVGVAFAYDLRSPPPLPIQQCSDPHLIGGAHQHRAKVSGQRLISGGVTDAMVRAMITSNPPKRRYITQLSNSRRKQRRSRTATISTTSTPVRGVRDRQDKIYWGMSCSGGG